VKLGYDGWTKTGVKWPNSIHSGINAYPLVGLAFALLITFMIGTSTPHHRWGPDLPRARFASPMPRAVREDAQIIYVLRDGAIYYGNSRIAGDELHVRIRESVKNGADRKIYICADVRAKYGPVNQVLTEISKADIQNICFLAEKVSP